MSQFERFLHDATSLLLWPVLGLLLLLVAVALHGLGGFLRDAWERRSAERRWRAAADAATDPRRPAMDLLGNLAGGRGWPGLLGRFAGLAAGTSDPLRLPALAERLDVAASRQVSRLQLLGRAGPTLGLMATLLPMGPALLALADHDVETLATSLATAFTATVLGLLVGLLGALMSTVRKHWQATDLAAIDAVLAAFGEDPQ